MSMEIGKAKGWKGKGNGNGNGGGRIARKGCVFVYVGEREKEKEQQERFVIPINDLHHPIFVQLLRAAEEAYGFHHDGPLKIPCNVDHFKKLKKMIRNAKTSPSYL
ncbi:hypothetical protein SUGI_1036150 [Cryptomeria japonica]|nr:hypothetical protein SUGI_1036150 [Cryptomeria japonica]